MQNYRIETVFLNSETVELRLYESAEDSTYRGWKMNLPIASAVADWWRNNGAQSPKGEKVKSDIVDMTLLSDSHAEIRALDSLGRPKLTGWSLPITVVEALEKELAMIRKKLH